MKLYSRLFSSITSHNPHAYLLIVLFGGLFLYSCSTTEPFSGYSYDPPDVTDTQDKEILYQNKRVIGFGEPRIWISNEFSGARVSDAWLASGLVQDTVVIRIKPENAPINNSPWYAFQIWSDQAHEVLIRLSYEGARHRYIPKIASITEPSNWNLLTDSTSYSADGSVHFNVQIGADKQWIAAHPIHPNSVEALEEYPESNGFASEILVDTVGYF